MRKESLRFATNTSRNQRILDIGTGSGILIPSLARYGEVSAIDLEPIFLKKAKALAARYNLPADIQQADILNLPFPDSTFDTITCISILEHVQDLDKAFAETRRVMKPGAILIVGVPIERFLVKSIFNLFGIKKEEDRGHCSHYTIIEKKLRKYFRLEHQKKIPSFLPDSLSLYKIYKCSKIES